ncbi:DUF2510 domain-containing protein [Streptomyces sp. PU10]|nr:DUF2510 domain-containing protein [Streptomyces sp. PU10]MDU0254192.1 DUF2510 domain-containing protein [Streptomyces sp. PU10]
MLEPLYQPPSRYGTTDMSAPTPAPGDDRPREGYYPDPSIPGYVRYWNGASWVAGTSRPPPRTASRSRLRPARGPPSRRQDRTSSTRTRSRTRRRPRPSTAAVRSPPRPGAPTAPVRPVPPTPRTSAWPGRARRGARTRGSRTPGSRHRPRTMPRRRAGQAGRLTPPRLPLRRLRLLRLPPRLRRVLPPRLPLCPAPPRLPLPLPARRRGSPRPATRSSSAVPRWAGRAHRHRAALPPPRRTRAP